jgi:hypothetical protein
MIKISYGLMRIDLKELLVDMFYETKKLLSYIEKKRDFFFSLYSGKLMSHK